MGDLHAHGPGASADYSIGMLEKQWPLALLNFSTSIAGLSLAGRVNAFSVALAFSGRRVCMYDVKNLHIEVFRWLCVVSRSRAHGSSR